MSGPASLPMYDWAEVRWAVDRLWEFLRDELRAGGIEAPQSLSRDGHFHAPWHDADLLISQTCGFPFTHQFRDRLQLLATPCYSVAGCAGADYSSAIIARRGDGRAILADPSRFTAAVNSADSQSGYWALRAFLANHGNGAPARLVRSGGHRPSLRMVAAGDADLAAVDAVCIALAGRHEAEAMTRIEIIGWSPPAPGLPFVTSLVRDLQQRMLLVKALRSAVIAPQLEDARQAMFLADVVELPAVAYDRIIELERQAERLPFPALPAARG